MKKTILTLMILSLAALLYPADKGVSIKDAELVEKDMIRLKMSGLTEDYVKKVKITITPDIKVLSSERKGPFLFVKTTADYKEETNYTVKLKEKSEIEAGLNTTLLYELKFDAMYSEKQLGYHFENGNSVFRLFVPRGKKVELIVFNKYDDKDGTTYQMTNDGSQVFEYTIKGTLWGKYYGYRITERIGTPAAFKPTLPPDTIFADPYSFTLATNNVFPQKGLTLIHDISGYDWENDQYMNVKLADAVILESHVKDLTAHASAGSAFPGTYKGLTDAKTGGINYIKKLGVNVVELLPVQDFGNVEPPYKQTNSGFTNNWNGYEQNYWGYMTTNFFTPESYYATDGTMNKAKWNGTDGRVVNEFRDMIKAFHKNGIAVILDVVYNHVSQYDMNPLKIIDYDFYFKKKDNVGCGNELNTKRLMARKLVVDSVGYWLKEFHVDGYRFDLATSFEPDTVKAIMKKAKEINPNVIMTAEPWVAGGSGASSKKDFLDAGYAIWNDSSRAAIRGGANRPLKKGQAFMIGNANNAADLAKYWKGISLGNSWQSVDYISSHDDTEVSDMIRILSGSYEYLDKDGNINRIKDRAAFVKYNDTLLKMAKNAAVSLFFCQGPIMLHLGQEFGRTKLTPDQTGKVPEVTTNGPIGSGSDNLVFLVPSPNSYQADNETNYINYNDIKLNQELFDYYRGLIRLRGMEELFRKSKPEEITILNAANKNSLGINLKNRIFGFVNTDPSNPAEYEIPQGKYSVLVNGKSAGTEELSVISGGKITVDPATSLIIKLK